MPSDGSGNYSKPAGSTAVTGETITASTHNTPIDDIAAALTARLMRNGAGGMTGDLPMNNNSITGAADVESDTFTVGETIDFAAAVNVASAAECEIGAVASNFVNITGTTTIEGFDTAEAGVVRFAKFAGALTLEHDGTALILPGGANIATAAGDTAVFVSEGSGNWRCYAYVRASGKPVKGATPGTTTDNTVPRFNGTAGEIQDSGVTINDDDDVSGVRNLAIEGDAAIPGTVTLTEQTAPDTPASGKVVVYPKSDGLVYSKDDAGTERVLGAPPKSVATAWVTFDGTASPPTIRDSYNVSSVTDNGTGDFTINFTNELANANYIVIGEAQKSFTLFFVVRTTTRTESAVRVEIVGSSGNAADPTICSVVIFGGI